MHRYLCPVNNVITVIDTNAEAGLASTHALLTYRCKCNYRVRAEFLVQRIPMYSYWNDANVHIKQLTGRKR